MQWLGGSWAGDPRIVGGGPNRRHPGDELPWGTSRVLPSLGTAKLLPELGTAYR